MPKVKKTRNTPQDHNRVLFHAGMLYGMGMEQHGVGDYGSA